MKSLCIFVDMRVSATHSVWITGGRSFRMVLGATGLLFASELRAQCPNGAPPPCATPRRSVVPPPPELRARRFLLLPFRNVTRRPEQEWLVSGSPLMLAQTLGQFSDLHVVPEERLAAARRRVGIRAETQPDATQLRLLADETGGWTAVSGSVFATGPRLRIAVQALDVVTSRMLVRAETEIPLDADPREAFDRLTVRLLEPTGVPSAGSALALLTTQSVDAYRAYANGWVLYKRSLFRDAEAEFTKAVRLDSNFALAWDGLAMAAVSAGGIIGILNPLSLPYQAIQRATRLADRLPPRQAALVRARQAVFQGSRRRSRELLDSLFRADSTDVETAYWLAMTHLMAPPVDTSTTPFRLKTDPKLVIALTRMILEREPDRRIAYQAPIVLFGLGGGMLWGDVFASRREYGSFAATMIAPAEVREVPIVQDDGTVTMMPTASFDSLPAERQRQLRRRSADQAWVWVERWLSAGPDDTEAHMYAARVAMTRADYSRALRELEIADSLGIQSPIENVRGLRLQLLVLSGRHDEAAGFADSLLAAGALTNAPFIRIFDRRRQYGAAALILARRWDRVAAMVEAMRGPAPTGQPACSVLRRELDGLGMASLDEGVSSAVAEAVTGHVEAFRAVPLLAPCAESLGKGPALRPQGGQAAASGGGGTTMQMAMDFKGAGRPLVLVGGGLTGWLSWIPIQERLAGTRRVARAQPLNVQLGLDGQTLPANYSVKLESRALAAALDDAGLNEAVDLVAWSYGALVTLDFALDHAKRVRTLTLIEPPAFWVLEATNQVDDRSRRERDDLKQLHEEMRGDVSEDQLERFLMQAGFGAPGASLRSLPPWPTWVKHRRSLLQGPAVFAHVDGADRLRAFQPPVLLFKGTGSTHAFHRIVDVLGTTLPNARVVELPGGHGPQLAATEDFLRLLHDLQDPRAR